MLLQFFFYWYFMMLTATPGGRVYGTGDWRLPQSDADFGDRIEARWVIAGTEGRSACYAWVRPEEGYHFVGFFDSKGKQVTDADQLDEIRLWASTDNYAEEDGIVSGNDFYPTVPQTLTAVFESDVPAAINSPGDAAATYNSAAADLFDLAGRKITTPHGGQIIIRNRKKVIF